MSLRLYGTISGCGRSGGAVIPALGSGRYTPGPNIVLPSWLKGSDPNFTINGFWGQPGALATVSFCRRHTTKYELHKGRKSPGCLAVTARRILAEGCLYGSVVKLLFREFGSL